MAKPKKKKAASKKSSSKRSKAKKPKKAAKKRGNYVPFKVLKERAARLQRMVDYREGKAKFA